MAKRNRILILSRLSNDKQRCLGEIVKEEQVSAGTKITIEHKDKSTSKVIKEYKNIIDVDAPGSLLSHFSDEDVIEAYLYIPQSKRKTRL